MVTELTQDQIKEFNRIREQKRPIAQGQPGGIVIDLNQIRKARVQTPLLNLSETLPLAETPDFDAWAGFDIHRNAQVTAAVDATIRWYKECLNTGETLLLMGGTGVGKTEIARRVQRAWGMDAQLWTEPALLDEIKLSYSDGVGKSRLIQRVNMARLLILDDLGTAHVRDESAPWLHEIYWQILDQRKELKRPALITTNLKLSEIGEWIGDRAASRLLGMISKKENIVNLFVVSDFRSEWLIK